MNTSLNNIKQQLLHLLPEDGSAVLVNQLKHWGFPEIIADRIHLEISDEMYSLISRALTSWINIDEEEYVRITDNYLESIIAITKIPSDVLPTYIERVINEIIEQSLQPRIKIPQQLFGGDKSLNYAEISYRSRYVMQHKTLVTAILRYMERKGLTELTLEQATDLIKKIDERLVATYTPEDWANALEIPFSMMEGRMEASMILRFFEHRGATTYADKFRGKSGLITTQAFLDLLFEEPEAQPIPLEPVPAPMEPALPPTSIAAASAPIATIEMPEETNLLGSLTTDGAIPLWQRFLHQVPEEPDTMTSPLSTLSSRASKMELQEWLMTDQTAFVRDVFRGNQEHYKRLLEELNPLNNWQQAQDCLQTRWLPHLEVDLDDETFILFIDQLQSYFNYKQS
jgi:hypothetical protein